MLRVVLNTTLSEESGETFRKDVQSQNDRRVVLQRGCASDDASVMVTCNMEPHNDIAVTCTSPRKSGRITSTMHNVDEVRFTRTVSCYPETLKQSNFESMGEGSPIHEDLAAVLACNELLMRRLTENVPDDGMLLTCINDQQRHHKQREEPLWKALEACAEVKTLRFFTYLPHMHIRCRTMACLRVCIQQLSECE